MPTTPNESAFEQATIERLKRLGYRHQLGSAIDRHLHIVVLTDLLRTHLNRRYHQLPVEAIEQVVQQAGAPEGLTLERRNQSFQRLLRSGVTVHHQQDGHDQSAHLYLVDYEHPERNDFLIVSQLTVQGASGAGGSGNTRRPDLVIYVNGLPLVIFELKSPWDEFV
ncbi:MAG: type I restriction endonuclease subunit R, partial [Oscillochloris sp.]|nr:type I restriction endonuclease subunit R [Oscillochloris sp.]